MKPIKNKLHICQPSKNLVWPSRITYGVGLDVVANIKDDIRILIDRRIRYPIIETLRDETN